MTEQTAQSGQIGHLDQLVRQTGVFRCLECGKCTAICPISQYDHHFSPRRTVGRALMRHDQALLSDDRLWTCLTCWHCSQVCPAGVAYPELTLGVRAEARQLGAAVVCTHGEAIHTWMRMMMDPQLRQDRLGWLGNDSTHHAPLATCPDSDTLYFVGCAPYYAALFKPLGVDGQGIARSTVRILNKLGVQPQVLADERCCGHDLLWEGDVEGFRALARLNASLIRASGAKRIVTSCPECARALKIDYPAYGFDLDVEVLHLAEWLAGQSFPAAHSEAHAAALPSRSHRPHAPASVVTYHDACRLGRHLGSYAPPRQVIESLGLELVEMQRVRENALCCGTNGWTHCTVANKAIQVDRLREARATGAELLVTTCIKCQIHFRCAMQDQGLKDEIAIETRDLASLVAEMLDYGE
jgi:heterodisulfide reductase subunit D